jgi:hypothetical protein
MNHCIFILVGELLDRCFDEAKLAYGPQKWWAPVHQHPGEFILKYEHFPATWQPVGPEWWYIIILLVLGSQKLGRLVTMVPKAIAIMLKCTHTSQRDYFEVHESTKLKTKIK